MSQQNNSLNLSNMPITQGVTLLQASYGNAVSGAGDVNGDGWDDFIIGAFPANSDTGVTYVVFGSSSLSFTINLASLTPTQGVSISGAPTGSFSGYSVSGGDINGDGFSDVVVGAPYANSNAGITYVVFGSSSLSSINLSSLGSLGFQISGAISNGYIGLSVNSQYDINKDGYNDIILGAYGVNLVYVIYGSSTIFSSINLNSITETQGFTISGAPSNSNFGFDISGCDVNNDGYADVIIGAPGPANNYAGVTYIIYGQSSMDFSTDVSNMPISQGFSILGSAQSKSGYSVSCAGDVNEDRYNDIIIGAPEVNNYYGASYVVFGNNSFPSQVNLNNLSKTEGFDIIGASGCTGFFIGGAGDINADGIDDMIVSSPNISPSGITYIIYGNQNISNVILSDFTSSEGYYADGSTSRQSCGYAVSAGGAGDINKDGYDDILIGGFNAASSAGEAYLIYGSASGIVTLSPTTIPTMNPTNSPTVIPTAVPTTIPTAPTAVPTTIPTAPTAVPTTIPTVTPTNAPTVMPTAIPTTIPTAPTAVPTTIPTVTPTNAPTVMPTAIPTTIPTSEPSAQPTVQPSGSPTGQPNACPSSLPSSLPTGAPSEPRVIINNNHYQTSNLLISVFSSIGSVISALTLYFGPNIVLNKWGYKFKIVKDITVNLQINEIGLAFHNQKLVAIHKKNIYPIHIEDQNNHGISARLYWIIVNQINKEVTNYKYIYNDSDKKDLLPMQIGLQYQKFNYLLNSQFSLFCNTGNLVALKKSENGYIQQYTIDIDNDPNNGISKGLYHAIVSEYNVLSEGPLLYPEQYQLRDFLLTSARIYPQTVIPIYTDLGYIKGFIYSCCLLLKKYQHSHAVRLNDETLDRIKMVIQNKIDLFESEESQTSVCVTGNISMKNILLSADNVQDIIEYSSNPILSDRSSIISDKQVLTEKHTSLKVDSISTQVDLVTSDIEQQTKVQLCIDALMDPKYVIQQSKAFSEFGEHLMLAYKDLSVVLDNSVSEMQKLLGDSTEDAASIVIYQEPTTTNLELSTSNYLIPSLFGVRQFIEWLPLIKYLAKVTMDLSGRNTSTPEILDSKPFLFSMHLVAGHAGAMLLPTDAINDGLVIATAGSMSYGVRLVASNYLNEQRQEILLQDEVIDSYKMTKYCASTILAYTAPSFAACTISNFILPGTPCSVTGYDLIISTSLGGSECYLVYKAKTQDDHKTTTDAVVPYIVDAVALAFASQYMNFDSSSLATMMLSVKQDLAVVSTVIAADYIGRMTIDIVPDEFKEAYVDPVFDYISEGICNTFAPVYNQYFA